MISTNDIIFAVIIIVLVILGVYLEHIQRKVNLILMERSELQTTDYSCGAVALRNVLQLYDQNSRVTEFELMHRLRSNAQIGTLPEDIIRVADDLGLDAVMLEKSQHSIEKAVNAGFPVIASVKIQGEGHYIVINGIDSEFIYYIDSYYTKTKMKIVEFLTNWDGIGIVIRPGPSPLQFAGYLKMGEKKIDGSR